MLKCKCGRYSSWLIEEGEVNIKCIICGRLWKFTVQLVEKGGVEVDKDQSNLFS